MTSTIRSKIKDPHIILLLGLLTTISPFSIDLYLSAFQRIADHYHTTTSQVALSLSSYFIGLSFGQIFYGPFLDRFGRKKPLYFGMILYILSSFACIYANSVESFVVARLFQALGGCAGSVASTAMVRDFFSAENAAKVFSRLMLILSVSPMFAPTVGGWIGAAWGWQAIFYALIIVVFFFLLLMIFFLPEGHKPDPTVSLKVTSIFKTFKEIIKNKHFFRYAVSGAFSFAGLFTYLAGAPAIFFDVYQISESSFGIIFAGLSVGMVGGGQINIFLMKKFKAERIYQTAITAQAIMAFIFAICAGLNWFNLYTLIAALFVYISCVGLTYPNAAALSLSHFRKNAGSASALLGTIQMGVGALASACFGLVKLPPTFAVGVIFVMTSTIGFSIWFLMRKQS